MSRRIPDHVLDELITSPAHAPAESWEQLITADDAHDQWSDALARRRALDAHAALTRGRPWLAQVFRLARRARRRLPRLLEAPPVRLTSGPPLASLSGALNPSDEQATPLTIDWSQASHRVPVAVGDVVRIAPVPAMTAWYSTSTATAPLPQLGWKVEKGDCPVLITLLIDAHPNAATLDDALDSASAITTVVLSFPDPENDAP
jgi:hypothetical protein